ncbi:hypothetical protein B5X24_HaOG202183 [Helicoverpa armigera]|uniref:NtA domain-containing protein n=1 Tax=Helicoverpa armigera TaxID=29058 RepID=A0A2W1BTU7_HELAM|nr:hypothetical protein B5X24_HaOG202183 [Helicoverpa armigera]
MRVSLVIVYVIALAIVVGGEIRIRGKVRKRNTSHRRHRAVLPPCSFNETIISDEWSLMEAIGKSKYIFTGKVLNVKKFRSDDESSRRKSNLYTVYLRRLLKGDISELRSFVKLEGSQETLSGSTLMVERQGARESCAPAPRPRLSAIFLSDGEYADKGRGPSPRLRILTDPVPLTLYHLDRVNAAVKGKFDSFIDLVDIRKHRFNHQ